MRLRRAWRTLYSKVVVAGRVAWGLVAGPLSALIATLADYGWRPTFLDTWTDPQSVVWTIQPWEAPAPFIQRVAASVRATIWGRAAGE